MTRTCKDCGITHPLTVEFFYRTGDVRYFMGHCKACHRLRGDRWEKDNPVKLQVYRRRHKPVTTEAGKARLAALPKAKRLPWVNAELQSRDRAKKAGAPHSLTPVEKKRARVYYHMAHLSEMVVDHVVALKDGGPHHPDNMQLMHLAENSMKGVRERDLRKMGDW